MDSFVARERELKILKQVHSSGKPEFIAVYGRRRVGKTFLIQKFFSDKSLFFEVIGTRKAKTTEQLLNFTNVLSKIFRKGERIEPSRTWNSALALLYKEIENYKKDERIVLFFDEIPWLASPKSGFLPALEYYWNRYFSRDPRIIVVVCGSASSWMIRRIINNRGGLYGRLTRTIRLVPFNIGEVEEFLNAHHVALDRKQIIELYMAIGGIPQYLGMVQRGMSATAAINELFFQPNAQLFPEFDKVFRSLFDNYESHVRIVRALASKFSGLTQIELLKTTGLSSGGTTSLIIRELQECGFVAYIPEFSHKKKEGRYILIDEYSLFYIVWVESAKKIALETMDRDHWFKMQRTHKWKSWSGYAFESLCLKHIQKIKNALGISGVSTVESGWNWIPQQGSKSVGAQIDLVIDRADRCTNLVEIKYSDGPFTITKAYAKQLENKKHLFREQTKSRKTLFMTLLTTHGVTQNKYALSTVDAEVTMDALFDW